ncbi:hypothetical protein WJX79_001575 [Trebouxia sp. C0005]
MKGCCEGAFSVTMLPISIGKVPSQLISLQMAPFPGKEAGMTSWRGDDRSSLDDSLHLSYSQLSQADTLQPISSSTVEMMKHTATDRATGFKLPGPTDPADIALALETADKQDAAIREFGAEWLVSVQASVPSGLWAQGDFPVKFTKAKESLASAHKKRPYPPTAASARVEPRAQRPRCLKPGHAWRQCPLLARHVARKFEAPLAVEDTMDIE